MNQLVVTLEKSHPLDCAVVAQVRAAHADCTWFYDHGYIRYNDGNPQRYREHQHVAHAAYDVGLGNGWHIHHIDRNRLNNRAANLAVLSATEHMRLTASEPKSERITLTCPICADQFQSTIYRAEQRGKTYCSELCHSFAMRKVERPARDQLSEMIRNIGNWSELGRTFGVTDNAVRKWARAYGLL